MRACFLLHRSDSMLSEFVGQRHSVFLQGCRSGRRLTVRRSEPVAFLGSRNASGRSTYQVVYLTVPRSIGGARQKNQRLRRLDAAKASETAAKPNVLGSGTLLMATVSVAVPAE